jgi:hypothetical protein
MHRPIPAGCVLALIDLKALAEQATIQTTQTR